MGKFEEIKNAYETKEPKWWFTNEAGEAFDWLLERVGELQKKYESRKFPVLGETGPSSVPWWWVMKHENAAKNQHSGQSVETLARRGGMSVSELYFAMRDEKFPWTNAEEGGWDKIERKALEWIDTRPWLKDENAVLAKQVADFNAVAGSNQKRYERAEAEVKKLKDSRTYWRSPVDVDQLRELHIAIEGYKREIEDLKGESI